MYFWNLKYFFNSVIHSVPLLHLPLFISLTHSPVPSFLSLCTYLFIHPSLLLSSLTSYHLHLSPLSYFSALVYLFIHLSSFLIYPPIIFCDIYPSIHPFLLSFPFSFFLSVQWQSFSYCHHIYQHTHIFHLALRKRDSLPLRESGFVKILPSFPSSLP